MRGKEEKGGAAVVPPRIMVVEDDPVTGKILRKLLSQMGCEHVVTVPSGEEALAELETFLPDLILMDIQLQGVMNGIDTARHILERLTIPIIFLSAHAEEGLIHLAKSIRTYGYVLKPFREETLRIAMEMGMARAREDRVLQASESMFRSLVEVTSDWIWEIDPEDRYVYASPKVRDVLGYAPEEVLGRRPFEFMPPEESRRMEALFASVKKSRVAFNQVENRNRNRNGDTVIVETSGVPVFDAGGAFCGYRGIDRDVTERKRAEERIVHAKKEWEGTFDAVPDCIMILDEQRRILRLNRAMAERSGLPGREAVGRFCYESVHGTSEPPEHCRHALVLADGRERMWEFHERFLCGHFLASSSLLTMDGEKTKVVHILRDISEMKRLEREIIETEDRERNRIGLDLHDELGQQLTGISFLCKILEARMREQGLPEAGEMDRIGKHVREAIFNTRKLAAGLQPVKPVADGLASALRDMACRVEEWFGIDCVFLCEEPVHVCSSAAATHLYRIAQEAIHNAIKHGEAGHVAVTLNRMNATLFLSVESDGRAFAGSVEETHGMGLKIIHYRANMIGASLQIEVRGGGGSVLTVKWNEEAAEER